MIKYSPNYYAEFYNTQTDGWEFPNLHWSGALVQSSASPNANIQTGKFTTQFQDLKGVFLTLSECWCLKAYMGAHQGKMKTKTVFKVENEAWEEH